MIVYCVGLGLVLVFELVLFLNQNNTGGFDVIVKGDLNKETVDVTSTVSPRSAKVKSMHGCLRLGLIQNKTGNENGNRNGNGNN